MYGRLGLSFLISTAITSTLPVFAGTSDTDYSFIVDRLEYNCQHFGEAYQEIGSFETANFHVNLCAMGKRYFYMGIPKNKNLKSNFIAAYPIDGVNTYQADNGNSSYIVEINPTQETLIIQRNGRTVVVETAFEPHTDSMLESFSHSLLQNCPEVNYDSEVQIFPRLNYSKDRVSSVSDRNYWESEGIYTSSINLFNKSRVKDISQSKVFTSVSNSLSIFSYCF